LYFQEEIDLLYLRHGARLAHSYARLRRSMMSAIHSVA